MKRTEHPNPQFMRDSYICLNGKWEFEMGKPENKLNDKLSGEIEVPFCVESKLSGIGYTDFINNCAYSKVINVTSEDMKGRLVLHIGACDYLSTVYLNGKKIKEHKGGYTPFEVDLIPYAVEGENRITITVYDDMLSYFASGKQSYKKDSFGCFYTRTTGIWQTVYLEKTPKNYIQNFRFYPDVEGQKVKITADLCGSDTFKAEVYYNGKKVGEGVKEGVFGITHLVIDLAEKHLWEVGNGRLYDVVLTFGEDKVTTYFGLRSCKYEGKKFLLNGKSVFQRLVLDQGFYPNGIYTAETDEELKKDIELSLKVGFNGARLHQKVFEPRFLYHCDKMGYIVWGEFPSWGIDFTNLDSMPQIIGEWTEVLERDFNHPSIISWCPTNEVWFGHNKIDFGRHEYERDYRYIDIIYNVTKALDETRPCVAVSGGHFGRFTDLYDFHCYEDVDKLQEKVDNAINNGVWDFWLFNPRGAKEEGSLFGKVDKPYNLSEYGGVAYNKNGESWGYHVADSEEFFVNDYVAKTAVAVRNKNISGFCYTQLYDVEQEQNGLYTYERELKVGEEGLSKIYAINTELAEIEK